MATVSSEQGDREKATAAVACFRFVTSANVCAMSIAQIVVAVMLLQQRLERHFTRKCLGPKHFAVKHLSTARLVQLSASLPGSPGRPGKRFPNGQIASLGRDVMGYAALPEERAAAGLAGDPGLFISPHVIHRLRSSRCRRRRALTNPAGTPPAEWF